MPMSNEDKRKYPRVPTCNVVSYVCMDDEGHPVEEGMGMTVNISQGGTLIETSRPITSAFVLLISIDLKKNVLETRGRVIHSQEVADGKYLTGVEFLGSKEEITHIVKNFIIDFHSRKNQTR